MTTLAAAYLVAWFAVALYIGWLGAQQHRLAHRIEELEALLCASQPRNKRTSQAA